MTLYPHRLPHHAVCRCGHPATDHGPACGVQGNLGRCDCAEYFPWRRAHYYDGTSPADAPGTALHAIFTANQMLDICDKAPGLCDECAHAVVGALMLAERRLRAR